MKSAIKFPSAAAALLAAAVMLVLFAGNGWGQFTQGKASKIDVSGYPADIQNDYKVYTTRCATCHELGGATRKLKVAPAQQEFWVRKMRSMPSVNVKEQDAKRILAFLSYDNLIVRRARKLKMRQLIPKTQHPLLRGSSSMRIRAATRVTPLVEKVEAGRLLSTTWDGALIARSLRSA